MDCLSTSGLLYSQISQGVLLSLLAVQYAFAREGVVELTLLRSIDPKAFFGVV